VRRAIRMNIAILLRSEKAERCRRRIPTTGRRNRCDGQDRHIHDNNIVLARPQNAEFPYGWAISSKNSALSAC